MYDLFDQAFLARAGSFPKDPNFSNVSLLLHGDGTNGSTTITDNSPSPKTVTAVGNAQISTAQSKFGGASIAFDGNGDYLTAPVNAAFEFGTGDFTVEAWIRIASFAGNGSIVNVASLGRGANGGAPLITCGWFFRVEAATIIFYRYDGTTETNLSRSYTFSTNTWYHVAATRAGTSLRLFVDGVQQGAAFTNSVSYNRIATGGSQDLHVGRGLFGSSGTYELNGNIDDLRITKAARYTANFTPPTAPFPDA
jgi:hypothetical protein